MDANAFAWMTYWVPLLNLGVTTARNYLIYYRYDEQYKIPVIFFFKKVLLQPSQLQTYFLFIGATSFCCGRCNCLIWPKSCSVDTNSPSVSQFCQHQTILVCLSETFLKPLYSFANNSLTVRRSDKFFIKIVWHRFYKCSKLTILLLKIGASLSISRSWYFPIGTPWHRGCFSSVCINEYKSFLLWIDFGIEVMGVVLNFPPRMNLCSPFADTMTSHACHKTVQHIVQMYCTLTNVCIRKPVRKLFGYEIGILINFPGKRTRLVAFF